MGNRSFADPRCSSRRSSHGGQDTMGLKSFDICQSAATHMTNIGTYHALMCRRLFTQTPRHSRCSTERVHFAALDDADCPALVCCGVRGRIF
jgi:hypothetical protein